jgi:integrase
MAKRNGFTVKAIENLQPRDERYEVPDPGCAGLYLQVHPSGAKSWSYRFRFAGKSRKLTIGAAFTDKGAEVIKIADARDVADEARVLVAKRIDPTAVKKQQRDEAAKEAAAASNTLKARAEEWLDRNKHLRSAGHRKKVFERLIYPKLGDRQIESIKRSEVAELLREIAKDRGAVMADYVLAMLRRLFNRYAIDSDEYRSPIVPGMAMTSTKERARKRTLSDAEMTALWRATAEAGMFGGYCRFLLLTATRRNEACDLPRKEINGKDWTIPGERYKTKIDHLVPLSDAAAEVLHGVPKIGRTFVFTVDGERPFTGYGCRKKELDRLMLGELRKIAEEAGDDTSDVTLERWTLHDLRRTARTLMSRAGVSSDHAEACLGHVLKGVEGTYNRHHYREEKRQAFEKLADLIDRIVNPGANVIPLAERRA